MNPTPQELLAGNQTGDGANVQPCYSPSDTQVNWIGQDAMSCTYQQAIIAPAGYQFQLNRPATTTICRQGNSNDPTRLLHSAQTIYQPSMAPTPPSQIPLSPTDLYSTPPPPANPVPSQHGTQYQIRQQQSFQPYVHTTARGNFLQSQQLQQQQQQHQNQQPLSYQQTSINQNPTTQQPSQRNAYLYMTAYNSGPVNVRQQLVHHVAGRQQQYIVTTPTGLPQPTPPPSARSTSRSGSGQRRNYTRRNQDTCLSALLTTTVSSNVDPEDQSRCTVPIPYTPKHSGILNSGRVPELGHNPSIDLPPVSSSPCCSSVNQTSAPLPAIDNQCDQCITRPPVTTLACGVPTPASLPQPLTPAQLPSALVTRPQPSLIHHVHPINTVAQAQPHFVPPVSVSSTIRISTLQSTSNVGVQVRPETANKACQFVSDTKLHKDESVSATVFTQDSGCQTEDSTLAEGSSGKIYVDRACSPIVFPQASPDLHVRRKITAKRKLPRKQTPSPTSPPLLNATDGQTSSDSEIDVIE